MLTESSGHGGDTTSSYYYYMWRFGWVWFLIALFFSIVAFFSGFLACCGRIGAFISSMFSMLALVFWTLAAVFMTYVQCLPRIFVFLLRRALNIWRNETMLTRN